jgi:polar amino acid transport system permease protein
VTPPGDRRAVRAAAARAAARRGAIIATVSSILVIGGLVAILVLSPGWQNFRELFLSWTYFEKSFPSILRAFWTDVKLFLIVEVVVLILGLVIAVLRTTRAPALFPLRLLSSIYVDTLRGIPTILLVYLLGFGMPALYISWLPSDSLFWGGVALALSYSAYVGEVYRAGILSVHPSQRAAARSLGLSHPQTMRHIVLPQAVRSVMPALLNDFISLQKDVALVSVLGPVEAFRVAQIYSAEYFNYTPIVAAALLYIAVTIPLARVLDRIQAREHRTRSIGGLA